MPGRFVISLDFELLWGIHDQPGMAKLADRIRVTRSVVPRLLETFVESGLHVTWATVGALGCHDVDDLRASLPEGSPQYATTGSDPLRLADTLMRTSPELFFAPDLVRAVAHAPGQELGSHTMLHTCCLERGVTLEAFISDLRAARLVATRVRARPTSLVFPRNQYADAHVVAAARLGFTSYRGNPASILYTARAEGDSSLFIRGMRLLDAYLPLVDTRVAYSAVPSTVIRNVPASRFLRPLRRAGWSDVRLRRVLAEMRQAAVEGTAYHLWWHPHNFASDPDASLAYLEQIVAHFRYLADLTGMTTATMSEAAEVAA